MVWSVEASLPDAYRDFSVFIYRSVIIPFSSLLFANRTENKSLAKQNQMENGYEKNQVTTKDVHVQTVPVLIDNSYVESEPKLITLDDQGPKDQGYIANRHGEFLNMSPQQLAELDSNLSMEGKLIESPDSAVHGAMRTNPRVVELIKKEGNMTTANTNNNIRTNFDPLMRYSEEPLLPLSKACAPLIDIVHNIFWYVQIALDKTSEEPTDGLTIDESAAIRLYTMEWKRPHRSLYCLLNQTLMEASERRLRPYFKYLKLLVTAIVKLPCTPPMTIWRGVTKDVSGEFRPGTPVTWWSFSSCTATLPILENNMYLGNTGNRTLFSVEAINGRKIRAHSHFTTEDEILLLPGTQMVVQSQFSPAPNLHIIHLRQIIPGRVLLKPPFEGIVNIFHGLSQQEIFLYLGAHLYPKIM